jgi:hypothetical protein
MPAAAEQAKTSRRDGMKVFFRSEFVADSKHAVFIFVTFEVRLRSISARILQLLKHLIDSEPRGLERRPECLRRPRPVASSSDWLAAVARRLLNGH